MRALLGDVRSALRSIRHHPAFALTAMATLALGIGATTAVFSVVNAVLLRSLPYADADRVVIVWGDLRNRNVHDWPFSNPDFADLRDQSTSFEGLAAIVTGRNAIAGPNGEAEVIRNANATTNIFSVMGLRLERGRSFTDEEGLPPAPPPGQGGAPALPGKVPAPPAAAPQPPRKAILSHEFWQRHFGGEEKTLGSVVQVGNQSLEVIGILAPGAELLFSPGSGVEQRPDLWLPLRVDFTQGNRNNVGIRVVGRLKSGVSLTQAQADVDRIATDLRKRFAIKETAGLYFRVEPIAIDLVARVRQGILALMGAVLFVLLIACANVANLLLVRSVARERELAVRAALGAEQWTLVRQLLVESFVIAAGGLAGGLILAYEGIQLLLMLKPDNLPRLDTIGIDPAVLTFAAVLSVISAVVFGLVPALRSSRPDLAELLRRAGRTAGLGSGTRLRSGVVVAEVVLSFVLLIGCGLLLRSFVALQHIDPGFEPNGVLTFRLSNLRVRNTEEAGALVRLATERLRALPGVRNVTVANVLPLDGAQSNARYGPEAATKDPSLFQQADINAVSPSYFDTMRLRVLDGRTFTEADDRNDSMLVVIDRIVARRLFGGESAIGKRILSRIRTDEPETFEVIGVVEHLRRSSLAEEGREGLFFPSGLFGFVPGGRWAVRVDGDPAALAPAVRSEMSKLPGGPITTEVAPMSTFVERATAETRFALTLIGVFAVIAVILATVGLYSVLSTVVRLRTPEIGVRMAFGAHGPNIFRMMVSHGLWLAGLGLALGVVTAWLLTGTLQSLLVNVRPTDPLTFVAVIGLFLVMAALAAAIPALRASRLSPTVALREE